jgi:hypothetical protein
MLTLTVPGESVLSSIGLEICQEKPHLIMLAIIRQYWNGIDDNPEWNQALLYIPYKKKGKQEDLNNY